MVAQRIDSKCRIHAALQSGFDCKQIVVILDLTRQCKIVAASASVKIFDGKLCKLIRLDSRPEFIRSGSAAAEGSEPCKVIQRLAHGRMVHDAHGWQRNLHRRRFPHRSNTALPPQA